MARPSYGPEAKKRSRQLLAALLDYANDELDCDQTALEALRPQIQIHWQTEQRLVVRTKVRFLEGLTKLVQAPLNGEQIKEALRRFEDFLEMLEDNRPNRGGSETWHFTLKLWHSRRDRTANLQQFEHVWEHRRPQKSKQVTGVPEAASADADLDKTEDFWWQLCRNSLEAQQYQRLTSNPLTVTDGVTFDLHELYVPLGLMQRQRQDRLEPGSPEPSTSLDGLEAALEEADSEARLTLSEFFDRLSQGQQRIALIGEAGAGKTTLLQRIATWLLEQQALPIWISLADLQGATLEDYLLQDWLKQATGKIRVTPELQEALADQFQQGRVWLLLDAIDEMAVESATALATIARQLRGWIATAHVVLTCRSNVWDSGNNRLETFTPYCNLSFSPRPGAMGDLMAEFIDRWFQQVPELGDRLRQELNRPDRKRIRDTVKNPLRLALLCRSWSLSQGNLPQTKALLYQQFVETLYTWKQDRFPTTPAQRQQLNRALGQIALAALLRSDIRFRLPQSFIQTTLADLDFMPLALQLGWLNQVGITASGEKIYAFYHPTFQEYFAAQSVSDWQFFLASTQDFPVFSSHWREVILLWLGRPEIAATDKADFLEALLAFEDGCGQFYSHRLSCLAAAGLAEFPQYPRTGTILSQLLDWRFGSVPAPLCEAARVALLQTDRALAIAALEQFIRSPAPLVARWQAAYTLGKTLDPGNSTAIATLTHLIQTLHNPGLRLQISESLGRIDPSNPIVLQALAEIAQSSVQETIRRRAAYSLGKFDPGNAAAIASLEALITSTQNLPLRLQAAESLVAIDPGNATARSVLAPRQAPRKKTRPQHRAESKVNPDLSQFITNLEQKLEMITEVTNQRRIAHRLGVLQPGHPQAIATLLQLLFQAPDSLCKRVVEDLKAVLLPEQLTIVVAYLQRELANTDLSQVTQYQSVRLHECYKLLWYCAQRLSYVRFLQVWKGGQ